MPNKRQGTRAILGAINAKGEDTIWFATGEVTAVRKSDRRIRVKILPELLETNWIRIFWPLAGQDYGIYVLPEVGTELGLLFVGAEPNFAFAFGNLNDDDDEIPEITADYDFILKPKQGGFIKISADNGIEIYSDQKVVVNCDDVHLGNESGSPVLTADTFLPKYNEDMAKLLVHTNLIAPDPTLAGIGLATAATHAATKVQAT